MKEDELDKYLGEFVKIKDFDNNIEFGNLYKIKDGICIRRGQEEYHPINNGYYLECINKGVCYRKSHIKKIEIV